jgi:hypothetical protein
LNSISLSVHFRGGHDKPQHIYGKPPHIFYSVRAHAFRILRRSGGMLFRKQLTVRVQIRCLGLITWLLQNIVLHSLCPLQYNAPLVLHLVRQGKMLHNFRRQLRNPIVFELMQHVCDLNDGDRFVRVPFCLV